MILDDLAAATRARVARKKKEAPFEEVKEKALQLAKSEGEFTFPFEKAIAKEGISFICEVKKASPSKGIIAEDFPYLDIARDYEQAGADCISVLTETDYFKGDDRFLREINDVVSTPTIRKDFIIDSYMIYEAKLLGASCVLLIAALLDTDTIREYKAVCDELGLSALVEAHDEEELKSALDAGARLVGVNNRDLKTFTVDIHNSIRLRNLVPENILFVAESGIKNADDIKALRNAGVNGVLIGETLMRSSDKAEMLNKLKGMTKVKICGLKTLADVEKVNKYLPEYIGFVFADTRRFVTDEQALAMKQALDKRIQAVGVFVDEPAEHVISLCERGIIDVVQLHGDEPEEYIRKIKEKTDAPVIKAVKVQSAALVLERMSEEADFMLFDTYKKGELGGTGERFPLEILEESLKKMQSDKRKVKPYFLAGGLDCENVAQAVGQSGCYAVDVSTGVETDGVKDENKIKQFIMRVRNI